MTHALTPADERALVAMEKLAKGRCYGLVRANALGEELWSDSALRNGYRGSNCSAPFARPAGKVLKRLVDRELVEYVSFERNDRAVAWGWRLTAKGKRWREMLRTPPA